MLWDRPLDLPGDFGKYVFGSVSEKRTAAEGLCAGATAFTDIDGDGRNEAAAFLLRSNPAERTIICYDDDGAVLWEKAFNLRFIYTADDDVNDRFVRALSFQRIAGRERLCLFVLLNVYRCAPSAFLILDATSGELLFEYDHIGGLVFYKYALIRGRPFILLGGTNNLARRDAVLAVIDAERLESGLAPPYAPEPGSQMEKEDLAPYLAQAGKRAGQAHYIRFARSSFSEKTGLNWLFVHDAAVEGPHIYVAIDKAPGCALYYHFDSDFRPVYIKPGSDFERNIDLWCRNGSLAESGEAYLERSLREISYWNGDGWVQSGGPPSLDAAGDPPLR
jgi:hypothetical protein